MHEVSFQGTPEQSCSSWAERAKRHCDIAETRSSARCSAWGEGATPGGPSEPLRAKLKEESKKSPGFSDTPLKISEGQGDGK